MAEVRIPFCATAEIPPPFILDETYADPNGVKSVLFDISKLQVAGKIETVDVPNIGPVQMCIYHVVGTIPYICNAFPIVQSNTAYDVQEQATTFDNAADNSSAACITTTTTTPLGWISAVGCLNVDSPVGGSCSLTNLPDIVSVTVDNLAVANNVTLTLSPTCPDAASPCGEEDKRVVKWRGCFVITTS
jgi:hypothetical protein